MSKRLNVGVSKQLGVGVSKRINGGMNLRVSLQCCRNLCRLQQPLQAAADGCFGLG